MALILLFLLLIGTNLIVLNNSSSFDLTLNVDGIDNSFRFVETPKSTKKHQLPSAVILDDDYNPTIINPSDLSSVQTYHVESDENLLGFATVINRTSINSNLLFAMVQTSNGAFYDISPPMSIAQTRTKRSLNDIYIVRSKNSVIEQAYVTIEWHNNRERREIDETEITTNSLDTEETRYPASESIGSSTFPSVSLPDTIENITIPSAENDTELIMNTTMKTTTPRPIPEKSRHLYLEIIAIIDSLITYDLRILLNKTELETIEILKLYYIHIFMGVEQLYRQSLIHETLDVHIRLSKIIFATDKHRLPWELYKNISSLTNTYRKTPNNMYLRPNVSMNLLKSLHQAYTSEKFDKRFFNNGADHIMTFTRLDLINGAGSAYVLGACLPSYRYSIIQEDLNSFAVMITVTHELGHNLGLNHDETENECNDPRLRYIMSPKNMNTIDRRQLPYFSECSIKQLNNFADNTTTTCWKNQIISTQNDTKFEELRNIISMKLGQIVNIHQQCQLQYGPQAIPFISVTYNSKNHTLYEENICNQLRCFKNPEDNYMYWQDGAFEGLFIILSI
jgi:predicted Zn-dependent protease